MKTQKLFTPVLWLAMALSSTAALASPTIDTLNVQAYMKKASGTAVTDGTYTLAIGVFQNGTCIWGKSYSTTITNGLFSKDLTGLGSDLSALGAGTGMNSNFSAVTLNPALLMAGGNGAVSIRIYAVSAIDGTNPQFDVSVASVPTAYVANTAKGVDTGSVGLVGIAAAAKTNSSAGAGDAGKLVLLDSNGYIDNTMINSISTTQIGAGVLGIARGGTNNGSLGVTNGGVVYTNGTQLANTGAGTAGQVLTSAGAGAPVWSDSVSLPGTASFAILATSGTSAFNGGVTMAGAGTGLSVVNNASVGGNLALTGNSTVGGTLAVTGTSAFTGNSGFTGNVDVGGVLAVTGTSAFAGNSGFSGDLAVGGVLAVTGTSGFTGAIQTGAGLTLGGNLTLPSAGSVTTGSGDATYTAAANANIRSASGSTTTVGNSGGASVTTVQSGTGDLSLLSASTGTTAINLAVSGVNGGINLVPNGTGKVTVNSGGGLQVGYTGTAMTNVRLCSVTSTNFAANVFSTLTVPSCTVTTSSTVGCNLTSTTAMAASLMIFTPFISNTPLLIRAWNPTGATALSSPTWRCVVFN